MRIAVGATPKPGRYRPIWTSGLLLAILLVGGALRLWRLGESPPGLNVDEAANAWNAYCLLKTGMDQHGVSWPILDSRGFGQGMTTVSLYALIPFQALFGLNIPTARLPAAFGGIVTILLLFWIGRRLFGTATGLIAAALLALLPWHLQVSRWGHMGALFPLLSLLPFAALLWAGFPLADGGVKARAGLDAPSPLRVLIAGLVAGLCTYGYFAARLYVPALLAGLVLATLPAWILTVRTRRGARCAGALAAGFLATFGPLAIRYLTDPQIAKRAAITWVWGETDTFAERVLKVLGRYPGHFGLDFLFLRGDPDPAYSPPDGYGLFLASTAPLLVAGLVAALALARTSRAARVLLVVVALYPVSDLLSEHPTSHSLRSLPGAWALSLLAALGAVAAWRWLRGTGGLRQISASSSTPIGAAGAQHTDRGRRPALAAAVAVLWTGLFVADDARFLHRFLGPFNREPAKYHVNHIDLLEACAWLRPRLDGFDAVYVTGAGMSHPYMYTLVALGYDPRRWLQDPKEFVAGPLPNGAYNHEEIYTRYGKMRFMIAASRLSAVDEVNELMKSGRHARLAFIVRPGELGLERRAPPALEIRNPLNEVVLSVFELDQ